MELEEMKKLWGEMSVEIEKQKKLTDSLIIKMTKANYRSKLGKILLPEAISTVVAFAMALFILINIQKLNSPYLLACGIATALILFILPILSLRAIYKMRGVDIARNTYKQSLQEYSKGKIQFMFVQKLSLYLTAILLVAALPAMSQLIGGKDVFKTNGLWIGYAVAFPFFYIFSRWVFKSYSKIAADAGNILKELET